MSGESFRFGPFELDPAREELRRSGSIVRIPRQPLRILLLLVRRAGEVVSREDIHEAIWGNETFVDFEHGINTAIRQIRFALGDDAEVPRYVRTLPRRGYSFIAAVQQGTEPGESAPEAVPVPPPPEAPARPRRTSPRAMLLAAAAIAALIGVAALIAGSRERQSCGRTIAVQPFRRLGPAIAGVDERSFPEELRAAISTLPRAHVSLIRSGQADLVVDGTIRQSEDGLRVIVSLADAAGTQIWTETFLRRAARREGMAVEVAHRVMQEVARRYLPPPRHEPLLATPASPSAVALYKRARLEHGNSYAYDWMRARALYEETLRAEPRFAEAWSGLSDVWGARALHGPMAERAGAAARAVDCARRAVALQPGNAEALSTLGALAAQRDFDPAAAEDLLRRAVAADPGYVDAHAHLSTILTMRGQIEEAVREWEIARQLDPVRNDLSTSEPFLYFYARRYDDARARFRDILAVTPEHQVAMWGLMYTYIAQKNWTEATALARTLPQARPVGSVPPTEAGFLEVYATFEEAVLERYRQGKANAYFLALYYSQLRRPDDAFAYLQQAVDARVPLVSYILVDPRIDNIRTDPRFDALVARLSLGRPPRSRAGGR